MARPRGRPLKGSSPAPDIEEFTTLLGLWSRAAAAPHGLAIQSDKPNLLLQKLYAVRREVGGFSELKLIEMDNEVRIVPR